ncbi:TPA: hypothetical protein ACYES5_004106 [Klebsiella oxytoca]
MVYTRLTFTLPGLYDKTMNEVWRKGSTEGDIPLPEAALDTPVRATRPQTAVNP